MKNELRIFFTALMFFTRIPGPEWVGYSEENINRANRYFPLVGWVVGGVAVFAIWGFHFILPLNVSVCISCITTVLLTGAFHEDGFADVCDGFGGGWTKERILEIMKDSRIGAYGVVGLVLLFALKILTLIEILSLDLLFGFKAVILSHVFSRFMAVTVIFTHDYVREDASTKVKPVAKSIQLKDLMLSFLWLLPAFILFQNVLALIVILPVLLIKMYLANYFKKWIGGYTGDCLGAVQQVTEVVVLLSCLILWKFI